MKQAILLLSAFLLITVSYAQEIRGRVLNERSNAPVQGLKVIYIDSSYETSTDAAGEFALPQGKAGKIEISGANFQTILLEWNGTTSADLQIKIKASSEDINTVVITHDRLKEKLRESPITVESQTARAIKETPASDFYEGLGHLRGVDVTAASMGFRIINTRGFNSTSPVRSLQLIDGVDNQAPGLNFSLGNFLGCSELDVDNTEIVVGASSAYFGPNAFNGVINITSKSPWKYQGLSAQIKVGEREMGQLMLRYAKSYKNAKGRDVFAWKASLCYFRAYDWVADNMEPTMDSKFGITNPGGYDAVNRYGDEVFGTASNDQASKSNRVNSPGLFGFYRDGYLEKEIVNYNTRNLKTNLLFAYKINDKNELQYGVNFGTGSTIYQGDNRYSLNGILFLQNRIEWIGKKGHLRFYATHEDAGKTYDAVLTAFLLQSQVNPGEFWYAQYQNGWDQNFKNQVKALPGYKELGSPIPGFPNYNPNWFVDQEKLLLGVHRNQIQQWHNQNRNSVNSFEGPWGSYNISSRLTPGTAAFENRKDEITGRYSYSNGGEILGSRFFDRSAMYHATGERRLKFEYFELTTGFSARMYKPNSRGTIFLDTGDNKITNMEAGVYSGIEKRFYKNRFKLNVTARLDKNQNFNFLFSPAASIIYSKNKLNTWRMSFSSAIRNPTLQDQYLHYNVGRAILLGNIHGMKDVYELQDFINFLNTGNHDTLRKMDIAPIKPEAVKTGELSYKGVLLRNKLTLDMGYYRSYYTNFIGYRVVIDAVIDSAQTTPLSANVYRVASNSSDIVRTQGFSVAAAYFFNKVYMLSANWSWNELNRLGSKDPLIPAFNTPRNKFNIMFGAPDLNRYLRTGKRSFSMHKLGFNVNFKYVQGFRYEGSPQFTGDVPSYWMLDAQVSKVIPKWKSTFKLGASNITNNKMFQVYGGPRIGRMAYLSITYEP